MPLSLYGRSVSAHLCDPMLEPPMAAPPVAATGGGEVFYEAAAVLASFVWLGHYCEIRARGGANDPIRTLLNFSPTKTTVIRRGQSVEIATSEIVVGDLLLLQRGAKIAFDDTVEDGESDGASRR